MVSIKPERPTESGSTLLPRSWWSRREFLKVAAGLLNVLVLRAAWGHFAALPLRMEFERRYAKWFAAVRQIEEESKQPLRGGYILYAPPEQAELRKMGPAIIPWLLEKNLDRQPNDPKMKNHWLTLVALQLARREDPDFLFKDSNSGFVRWWQARPQVPAEFDRLRAQGAQAKDGSPERAAAAKAIVALRLDALPLILERVKADQDRWLLPVFGELTDGQGITNLGDRQARLQYTLDWWARHKAEWTIPPVDAITIPARFAAKATAPAGRP